MVLIRSRTCVLAELQHLFRRVGRGEQRRRRLVDAGIGRLRRQHHRDQQRERIDVLQLALRRRIDRPETPERFRRLGLRPGPDIAMRGLEVSLDLRLGRSRFRGLAGLRSLQSCRQPLLEALGPSLGPSLGPVLDGLGRLGAGFGLFRFRSGGGRLFCHFTPILSGMTPDNDPNPDTPLFSAMMTPNRSLGKRGFGILMLAVAGMSFVAGLVFADRRGLADHRLLRPRRAADLLGVPGQLSRRPRL